MWSVREGEANAIIKNAGSQDGFIVLIILDVTVRILLRSFVCDFGINVEYSHLLDLKLICWLIFIYKFPGESYQYSWHDEWTRSGAKKKKKAN